MLTPQEKEELQSYIPESDMVKIVFSSIHPEIDTDDWNSVIIDMTKKALKGDKHAMFTLFELISANSYNEGMLDEISKEENY